MIFTDCSWIVDPLTTSKITFSLQACRKNQGFRGCKHTLMFQRFFHRFPVNFKHIVLCIFGVFGITYSASIFTSIFDLIFHGFGSQASSKWLPKLIPNPKGLPKMTPMWHCWAHKGPPTASKKHTFLQKVV